MPLSGYSHAHLHQGPDPTGDHELQTDIMRFLAILALCLMAVFALVQSLPQASEQPVEDPRPLLQAQIQAMLERVQALQIQRADLSGELDALRQSRNRVRHDLSDTESRLRTAAYRLQRSDARLKEMDRALDAGTQAVSALQQRRAGEERELQRVERRLAESRRELEQQMKQSRPKPEPVWRVADEAPRTREPVVAEPVAPAAAESRPPEQPEGFSLHFASAGSLQRLVAAGQVGFYARLPEGFWRLRIEAGHRQFSPADSPRSLYSMTADTVPDGFRTGLLRSSGQSIEQVEDWGVTLPPQIAERVQDAMQGRRGGALVIHADGRVEVGGVRGS